MRDRPPRLELHGVNKTFGDTQVLHDVSLKVSAGEIHGLAGQNGSGKSTLIKILTGVYSPESGAEMRVDGQRMRMPVRWRDVHKAGVSVVHQDLGVLDQLSVAENVCVGGFPSNRWLGNIDRRERDRLCAKSLSRVGAAIAPATVTGQLNAAERAEVAIARALRDHLPGEGLIILDEATRALSGEDLTRIHALLKRVAKEGTGVLMISHNLVELASLADRVSVLRDGFVVAAGVPTEDAGPEEIALHMLGAESAQRHLAPPQPETTDAAPRMVEVSRLKSARLHEIGFSLGAGEILGITGLPGNGYEEIPYHLTGAQNPISGTIDVHGTVLKLNSCTPGDAIAAGIVLIPERRDRDGLALEMSVRDNICLPGLRHHGRSWFVGRRWQQQTYEKFTRSLGIKTTGPMALVRELSGGNQQKALLAKWLSVKPKIVVLHEPTQAVDVAARRDILSSLVDIARQGVAVILVSSEAEDLIDICSRIMIYKPAAGLIQAQARTVDDLISEIYSLNAQVEA